MEKLFDIEPMYPNTTNRAEELISLISKKVWYDENGYECVSFGTVEEIIDNYSVPFQSEIDELTKRVNQLSEVNDKLIKENLKYEKQNAELTKEVERLRNKYEPSEYSKEVNEMYKKFSD